MIESSNIQEDSFTGSNVKNDASANVATYIAAPDTEQFGGSLDGSSFVTKSKLDLTLAEYLARPKLMYSGSLTTYSTSPNAYNFAYDYLSSADIVAKTRYIHLIRGTFQVKMIVTAAPYATGRIGLSSMYGKQADYGAGIINTNLLIANLASKTNVMLDLGSANTCMLSIPLHIRTPYVRNEQVDATELQKMTLYLYTLTQLLNSQTNSAVVVSFKIYVSLVDAETSIPVPILPTYSMAFQFVDKTPLNTINASTSGDYLPPLIESASGGIESDESTSIDEDLSYIQTSEQSQATSGVISGPASVIAEAANKLSNVPVIGKFAMATSIGAGAVGSIARLFGFSRPRDFSKPCYPHDANLSSSVGEVRAKQLTTDPNQETTIDSRFLGENGDSLSYENTIQRWGFAGRFQWQQAQAVGSGVAVIPITPRYSMTVGSGGVTYVAPTPLAYCASLFTAWRGSIRYKIVIPANRFVRGKLRAYWTPAYATPALDVISNNSLSVLIDLTQTVDLEITVPYMSDNMYKAVGPYIDTTTTADDKTVNGYLVFVVEEPLIANNTSWIAEMVVYTSASDDFELAIPSMQSVMGQSYDLIDSSATYTDYTWTPSSWNPSVALEYNADWYSKTSLSNSVNPAMTESVSLLPDSSDTTAPALIHIGESVPSLRTIIKRFHPLMWSPQVTLGASRFFVTQFIPYLPSPRQSEFISVGPPPAYIMSPYLTTPISFLSRMFGGMRGTMRYMINYQGPTVDVYVGRAYDTDYAVRTTTLTSSINMNFFNQYFKGGYNEFKQNYEPIIVDVPFQNYSWFYPTAKQTVYLGPSKYGIAFGGHIIDSTWREQLVHQSAGEDLQFVIYNGPPIVALRTL